MHSSASTTLSTRPGRRGSAVGAAMLAIAGNVLVVVILGVAALVALGAAVLVFGGGFSDLV